MATFYICDTSQQASIVPKPCGAVSPSLTDGAAGTVTLASRIASRPAMYLFRNVPTVETISLVVIDGPVVWLPRAVSEYLSFQLVALSGAAVIVLWKVADSDRQLIPGFSGNHRRCGRIP